ncbi:unnamed protein product, partial [Laminaria digitata]
TTAAAAVVNRTDTTTPPSATTASEAARPSPISTTGVQQPVFEEPRAVDSRTTRGGTFVIPPWRGASRDNRTTARTAEAAAATDTITPPSATTASEAPRPSPISTTDVQHPVFEEPRAVNSRTTRMRTFIIPSWRGASRDNRTPTARTATEATDTTAEVAAVSRPDNATPPPTTTASEAARPSPISTTDARPTPEEPRAIESRTTRLRTSVNPPWARASRDGSRTAAATAAEAAATTATAATAATATETATTAATAATATTATTTATAATATTATTAATATPVTAAAAEAAAAVPTREAERELTPGEARAI